MKNIILALALVIGSFFAAASASAQQQTGDSDTCKGKADGCDITLEMTEVNTPDGCFVSIKFTIVCGSQTCTRTRTVPCDSQNAVSVKCAGNDIEVSLDTGTWGGYPAGTGKCTDINYH